MEITQIKINWGWWTQWHKDNNNNGPYNNGWDALTANWVVTDDGGSYSYNYHVSSIYDIAAAE